MALFYGSNLAPPKRQFVLTEAVVLGHGILTTILLATKFLSKIDLIFTFISNLVLFIYVYTGMILNGKLTF